MRRFKYIFPIFLIIQTIVLMSTIAWHLHDDQNQDNQLNLSNSRQRVLATAIAYQNDLVNNLDNISRVNSPELATQATHVLLQKKQEIINISSVTDSAYNQQRALTHSTWTVKSLDNTSTSMIFYNHATKVTYQIDLDTQRLLQLIRYKTSLPNNIELSLLNTPTQTNQVKPVKASTFTVNFLDSSLLIQLSPASESFNYFSYISLFGLLLSGMLIASAFYLYRQLNLSSIIFTKKQLATQASISTLENQLLADKASSQQTLSVLTQTQFRLSSILNNTRDMILFLDQEGYITDANTTAKNLLNLSFSDPWNRVLIGDFIPELYTSDAQSFRKIALSYANKVFDANLIQANKNHMHIAATIDGSEFKEEYFFTLSFYNVDARKNEDNKLKITKDALIEKLTIQEQELNTFLSISPLAMAYINDFRFRTVNQALLHLFACSAEQLLNQSIKHIFTSEHSYLAHQNMMQSVLNTGDIYQVDLQLLDFKAQKQWVRIHAKRLNIDNPEQGEIWLFENISKQKQIEETLLQAKLQSEEHTRLKNEFFTNISHELRTPLHAIIGFSALGNKRKEIAADTKTVQYFDRISTSANRLLTLLNDLLDLSKFEAHQMQYNFQATNLNKVIQEEISTMSGMIQDRNIQIQFEPTLSDLQIEIDSFRIGQVLRNLLSNAIKFSLTQGTIVVSIEEYRLNDQSFTRITVADEGIGIPESELQLIFQSFTQSSLTTSSAGGTGLGLPICKQIIEAHHGRIFANNRSPKGAVITIEIPNQQNSI